MKRKAKSKNKIVPMSKLKPKRNRSTKLRSKKIVPARRTRKKMQKKAAISKSKAKNIAKESPIGKRIIRIMGHGQFVVNRSTLKILNKIDQVLVEIVSRERSNDGEFKKRLAELNDVVIKNGKQLDSHEIIKSDIILPSVDLSIDEAKKLFTGEGVIPEL
jgi:PspAA-like protein